MEDELEDLDEAEAPLVAALEGDGEERATSTDASEPESEAEGDEAADKKRNWRREGLLLLRDIGIAVLILVIVMAVIFAYTQVWPPMVVIESGSMQHSDEESSVGVIDTGDLVLVQKAETRSSLVSYAQGRATGHSTYGDYGDVVIFHERGITGKTPIIHRLFIYLEWNASAGSFDVPDLSYKYWMDRLDVEWGGTNEGATTNVTSPFGLDGILWISGVGVDGETITLSLRAYMGANASGYVTAGDNNIRVRGSGGVDPNLVRLEYIIGKARGELPWFGLLKLSIYGDDGSLQLFGDPQIPWGATCAVHGEQRCAQGNSWTMLTLSLILLFVGPVAADFGYSYWSKRKERRAAEAPDEEE